MRCFRLRLAAIPPTKKNHLAFFFVLCLKKWIKFFGLCNHLPGLNRTTGRRNVEVVAVSSHCGASCRCHGRTASFFGNVDVVGNMAMQRAMERKGGGGGMEETGLSANIRGAEFPNF